jgi:L-alanine-DL-glutamate epimerase-like enolase superfamily enzyme
MRAQTRIERIEAAAYRIPTDGPEADGTYAWSSTTLVTVHAYGGGMRGFGYSYGSAAMVALVREQLAPCVLGSDALAIERTWGALCREVRNVGRPGIAATAISAMDAALWDLKAKLLDVSLVSLLGAVRDVAHVYGSGGFTSYDLERLEEQACSFREQGIERFKMKIGEHPESDLDRVAAVRSRLGDRLELMVDANGAYGCKQALARAQRFAELGVTWFEEPVSSDDLVGLRLLRDRAPGGMNIAAGEYGYDLPYFRRMLEAGAVDVLQADATRCLGITGFMAAARLCEAFFVPLSAHTAPSLHAHPACAARALMHVEYFHDHARIEAMLFDGFAPPRNGAIAPDPDRPGIGVELKTADAERFRLQA